MLVPGVPYLIFNYLIHRFTKKKKTMFVSYLRLSKLLYRHTPWPWCCCTVTISTSTEPGYCKLVPFIADPIYPMATSSTTSEGAANGPDNNLFDDPDADIILRSCDSQEFRVLKLYIIKSSPVLKRLIQKASIPPDAVTPLPIVKMSDSGSILSSLLTFIFPMSPALPKSVEETIELLSTAQKYQMSSILNHIRGTISLQDPPFISRENAFYVYSLARKHVLLQEAAQAARITLKYTLTIEKIEDKLNVIPGAYLYELLEYHRGVQANISSDILEFRTSGAHGTLAGLNCVALTATPGILPQWLDNYICYIAYYPSFFDPAEFQATLASHISGGYCRFCSSIPSQTIHAFWSALSDVVHQSIKRVSVFDIDGGT
jgi:BTB/POZ domain